MYEDDELLALSGLQHAAYCERQWALIHIEQIWADSSDTVRGEFFHARADAPGYSCRRGVRSERGVRLVSYRLGLYGVADIVEYYESGNQLVMPVEYKVGKPKAEDWDRLQVAAQAMCLEEMEGVHVSVGALFYGETRRRETVIIDEGIRDRVRELSQRIHGLYSEQCTPAPTFSSKCRRCSLHNECLPELSGRDVHSYWMELEPLGLGPA